MIEPGELHRYFKVREIVTGRQVMILAGDTRYAVTGGGLRDYRPDRACESFLAESAVHTHPWGRPMRLEEVEPLPDGEGLYHPDHLRCTLALHLAMTYQGSWRQAADLARDPGPGARPGEEPHGGAPQPAVSPPGARHHAGDRSLSRTSPAGTVARRRYWAIPRCGHAAASGRPVR